MVACVQAIKEPVGPDKTARGRSLYEQAEELLKIKAYENSLKVYDEYLIKYPDQSLAYEALMKMGKIYAVLGRDEAKLNAYQKLVKDYPKSRFAYDAMMEILVDYYNKGQFKAVILQAAEILEKTDSKQHIFQTYVYLADTYTAMGAPMDAVYFINIAYKIAPEALKVFVEYINKFPGHENQEQALAYITLINQRFAFNRNDIGCLLPLSGSHAAFGMRALRGIKLALNTYHSLQNETHFNLIVQDSESDEQIAVKAVQALNKRNVSAIIGPMTACKSASKEAQKQKVPIIGLSQKDGISDIGDYVFRNFLTPQMQIDTIVSYAIEKLGARRFAVLYPEDVYGKTFLKLFQNKVADYGEQAVDVEAYQPDQTDFGSAIKKLINHSDAGRNGEGASGRKNHLKREEVDVNIDAVFIPDRSSTVGLITPQLRFYNIKDVLLLGTNLWHSEHLIEMARKYVQGAFVPDAFYSESKKKTGC